MSLDLTEFKCDILEIRDDIPVSFTFSGTGYTGFQTALSTTEELMPEKKPPRITRSGVIPRPNWRSV